MMTAALRTAPFLWAIMPTCGALGAWIGWRMGVARDAILPIRTAGGLALGLILGLCLTRGLRLVAGSGKSVRRTAWRIGAGLALVGAASAATLGYEITGWALVRPGGPTLLDYAEFAGLTAVVATIGALPGLLIVSVANARTDATP